MKQIHLSEDDRNKVIEKSNRQRKRGEKTRIVKKIEMKVVATRGWGLLPPSP